MAKTPTRTRSTRKSTQSTTSVSRKSASSAKKPAARQSTVRRKSTKKSTIEMSSISPERKTDVAGVLIGLVGILSLLSFIPMRSPQGMGVLVNPLAVAFGWGAIIFPILLLGMSIWILVRQFERIPALTAERIVGLVLLFLNVIVWIQLFTRAGWIGDRGGGWFGQNIESGLVNALGILGAIIALLAWLMIGLTFLFDLSVPDLVNRISDFIADFFNKLKSGKPGAAAGLEYQHKYKSLNAETELPRAFKPLNPIKEPVHKTPQRQVPPAASQTLGTKKATDADSKYANQTPDNKTDWHMPDMMKLFDPASPVFVQASIDKERARLIEDTLRSFGVPAHITEIQHGPTVTMFGVEPDFVETRSGRTRVRVSKITTLIDDLALALAAPSIRIQAPVPGRNFVGIEVPNTEIGRVSLREILESDAYRKKRVPLSIALGKNVSGKPVVVDLAGLPHLLIAGTTGSGKSVCINAILSCLLLNNSPRDLRMVLVDPKRVELTGYNGIPHLLGPVVTNSEHVIGALQWMQREMDSRYQRFSKSGVRNIEDYNSKVPDDHLPYYVVIIDELADLMMMAPDETERAITRLAQLARATGIHLILATQRPSVDVVTGLIKANFPARIAFAVASGVDSRVILDQPGAERLLGRGDMLYQAPDAAGPVRLQGVYVSDNEIQLLVDHWRFEGSSPERSTDGSDTLEVDMLPKGVPLKQAPLWEEMKEQNEGDPLLSEAIALVRREGRASITMLQRRMRLGYTRAARLVDAMEDKGIISPTMPNSQTREVLDYGEVGPPAEE